MTGNGLSVPVWLTILNSTLYELCLELMTIFTAQITYGHKYKAMLPSRAIGTYYKVSLSEIGHVHPLLLYLQMENSEIILIPEFSSWVSHRF